MSEEGMTHEQFLDLFGNVRISDTKKIQAYYGQIIDKLQKENAELKEELDYYKQKESQVFDERDYYEE